MKKEYLTVVFSIILLFFISPSVYAGFEIDVGSSYSTLNMEDFNDFLSTRGNENDEVLRSLVSEEVDRKNFDEIKNSLGVNIFGRYWFDELIAVGGGAEVFLISTSEYDLFLPETDHFDRFDIYNEDFQVGLYGVLAEVKYKVLDVDETTVNLNVGFGKYYSFLEWNKRYDRHAFDLEENRKENFVYNAESWGTKFGTQFSYRISDTTKLDTRLNYRLLVIDDYKDDEGKKFFDSYNNQVMEFDFSGFELISSVSFKF